MDLQSLIKQFANFSSSQNQQPNQSASPPKGQPSGPPLYPESLNTNNFHNSDQSYNNTYNTNQNNFQNSNTQNNQNSNSPFGDISSLLGFLPLLKGKSNFSSLLSSDIMPEGIKSFAPLISMLSSSTDKKSAPKENEIVIDNFKKIED